MYHFKLEKWDQYGPSIYFALGGKSEHEVKNLRSIMKDMIELSSPQDLDYIPSGGVGEASYQSDYSVESSSMHSTRSSGSMSGGHHRRYEKGMNEDPYQHRDGVVMMNGGGGGEVRASRLGSSGLRGILRSKSREPPTTAGRHNGTSHYFVQEKHQDYDAVTYPNSSPTTPTSGLGATKSILKKVFQRKESEIEATTESAYYNGGMSSPMNGHHPQQQQEYRY